MILELCEDGLGEIKLADFGLARIFAVSNVHFTPQVFSRWYRPPELLYNASAYGPSVDIWALGCVFGGHLMWLFFL